MTRALHQPGPDYSIAAVSKLTGISCHALRVWERRYGFPVPARSASGHRRYGADQVGMLRLLAGRMRQGEAVSDLIAAYRDGRLTLEPPGVPAETAPGGAPGTRAELVAALFACDARAAERALEELAAELPPAALVNEVIEPGLVEAGERWFRRKCDVFEEHFASGFLRRALARLVPPRPDAPAAPGPARTIALGTAQGDRHEGGILLVEFALRSAGWHVVNLGVDLPTAEYAKAARRFRPHALGVSFVLSRNIKKRFQELSRIANVPVFVGGRSILNYQGLARRHGLIPIAGPIVRTVAQLEAEFTAWQARRATGDD